jgi:hypothetical protein
VETSSRCGIGIVSQRGHSTLVVECERSDCLMSKRLD